VKATEFKKQLKTYYPEVRLLKSNEYITREEKVNLLCITCKTEFVKKVKDLDKKIKLKHEKFCPNCQRKLAAQKAGLTQRKLRRGIKSKNAKYSQKQYEALCKKAGLKPLGNFLNTMTPVKHTCLVCKSLYTIDSNYVERRIKKNLYGCSKCSCNNIKWTKARYNKKLREMKIPFAVKRNVQWVGISLPAIHTCTKCGYEKVMRGDNVLRKVSCQKGCPNCNKVSKYKNVKLKGRSFNLMGFEPQALEYLVNRKKIKLKEIVENSSGKVPVIHFKHNGNKKHYPDFYIPTSNTLVEVKSLVTMGMQKTGIKYYGKPSELFYLLVKKRRAAIKQGYKYKVLVMSNNGKRIRLPKKWWRHTYTELSKVMKSSPT